jgi:phage baseplate assembly protein W
LAMEIGKDILGTGWSFPVKIDGRGGIALSQHESDIEESIRIILGTAKGERRMRPEFGCEIHDLVFAPNNATTWGLAAHYVEDALGWWEPRIEVIQVDTAIDSEDSSRLLINIYYRIRSTNDERNLVFPFYIIPGRA